jgi:hypothetical protein
LTANFAACATADSVAILSRGVRIAAAIDHQERKRRHLDE